MAERNPAVKALVEQALSVLPQELGCDSCAEYLAVYADYRLGGTMPPDSLKGIGEHLDRCDACFEEFKLLLDAMLGADDHLGKPSGT
jgi:hypothetical protein